MSRHPAIPLTSVERKVVRAWTMRVFAVWTAIVVATLAAPTLLGGFTGAAQSQARQSAAEMQCVLSEASCRRRAAR
jgi:hypothetical protein